MYSNNKFNQQQNQSAWLEFVCYHAGDESVLSFFSA